MNLLSIFLQAQEGFLFTSDKIFTVLTVVLVIWLGILTWLFYTGMKVYRLEKQVEEIKQKNNNKG